MRIAILFVLLAAACTSTVTSGGHDAGRDLDDAGREQDCYLTHDDAGIMWVCDSGADQ